MVSKPELNFVMEVFMKIIQAAKKTPVGNWLRTKKGCAEYWLTLITTRRF